MIPDHLRTIADYHGGHDLAARLAHVDGILASKNHALRQAADEIERLQAKVEELKQRASQLQETLANTVL